jgi:uncharacterized membrane protein YfcA
MMYLIVCLVASLASCLTFFTGFGLGTLLMPALALFFAVEVAVAMTAVVHLLNGVFKLILVGREVHVGVVLRFGVPAILAALAGAWVLLWLAQLPVLHTYAAFDRTFVMTATGVGVGVLMLLFALVELAPGTRKLAIHPRYLPLGGVVSGFFGGLSGHQGAFRSAFLVRSGLGPASFVATGAAIALLIDLARLSLYLPRLLALDWQANGPVVGAAVASAFAGALIGAQLLEKVTLRGLQLAVAGLLFVIAAALIAGAI